MSEGEHSRRFDLEERTYEFGRRVRAFVKRLKRTLGNIEDARQLIRASGSVGANYIEANEALGKKDFLMRIKICRKEPQRTQGPQRKDNSENAPSQTQRANSAERPNIATRHTGRTNCNRDALAGFAAAHG